MVKKSVVLFVCVVLVVFAVLRLWQVLAGSRRRKSSRSCRAQKGGTLDQYFSEKAEVPALEDLGWIVYQRDYGFEVERMLVLDQNTQLLYKWSVDSAGNAKPLKWQSNGDHTRVFFSKAKR